MSSWGRKKNEEGRKSYTILQKYVFAALVAKSDVDLLALDKGDLDVNKACDALMTTLNEYANTGFHLLKNMIDKDMESVFENDGLLNFIKNFC
jgi:hypothetical protein